MMTISEKKETPADKNGRPNAERHSMDVRQQVIQCNFGADRSFVYRK